MTRYPLDAIMPPQGMLNDGELLTLFLEYVKEKGLTLYPAQEDAMLALYEGQNVILNTPTGSGKSLVAVSLHFQALASGRRSYYTCPIKALVNEKFLSLCKEFGPEKVGMITGDATVNGQAPIICCTAEILSNMALRDGADTPVGDVIMDEFHYYSDRERGVAWQIPLLTMPRARFLLMSATLGDTDFFEKELTKLTGRETVTIKSKDRPVPLDFIYKETPLYETIQELIQTGRSPIYLVNFTQRDTAEEAQNLLSVDFLTKDEKKTIADAMSGMRFTSPYGKDIQRLLKHGVGIHHAGLLPKYRVLVEGLAQKGLLKVISGTDTLGVGVNIPIRTVLFTKLCKYDGEKTGILSVRDFQQIAGRAGRKGFDDRGTVVAQAPEHVIENLNMERKAQGDAKKLRKIVKKKPPEKGFVLWTKETFEKLMSSPPEPLTSRFQVTHGMLLNVLSRSGGRGCDAMRQLIRDAHETPVVKDRLRKTAFQLFRSLVERDIVRFDRSDVGTQVKLNVDLQEDFSLNQALSLYLLDTLKLLDPAAEDFALNVVTLVESILENPELILRRQLDELRNRKFLEMKAAGVEYDERMEELEKLEHPKPLRDFIYDTFNEFARVHPWVGQENIRPKSVAREMYELFYSFNDYVKEYDLHRSEGLLLRYLSEVYKVLVQTVPPTSKSPEVEDIAVFFGAMIRQVDSSLIDEWERLRDPKWVPKDEAQTINEDANDVTRDPRAFTVLVRNEAFRLVRALARPDFEMVLSVIESEREPGVTWNRQALIEALDAYRKDHNGILTGPDARGAKAFRVKQESTAWHVEQLLFDPDGHDDWKIDLTVDLAKSREAGRPVIFLRGLGPIG